MGKLQKAAWLLTGRGVPGPHLGEPDTYKGHEITAYEVERRIGDAEIRRYPETLVAETTIDGMGQAALGEGFRRLARYIFGGNKGGRNIEMTAPVEKASRQIEMTAPVSRQDADGGTIVSFTLPRDLTLSTAPVPLDDRVRLTALSEERRAVLRFSGRSGADRMAAKGEELRELLRKDGLSWQEPLIEMRYDDPSTAPWTRRNEVAFVLG